MTPTPSLVWHQSTQADAADAIHMSGLARSVHWASRDQHTAHPRHHSRAGPSQQGYGPWTSSSCTPTPFSSLLHSNPPGQGLGDPMSTEAQSNVCPVPHEAILTPDSVASIRCAAHLIRQYSHSEGPMHKSAGHVCRLQVVSDGHVRQCMASQQRCIMCGACCECLHLPLLQEAAAWELHRCLHLPQSTTQAQTGADRNMGPTGSQSCTSATRAECCVVKV